MCDERSRLCCEAINEAVCEYEKGVRDATGIVVTQYDGNTGTQGSFDIFFVAIAGTSDPLVANQEASVLAALEELRARSKLCKLKCCDSAAAAIQCVGIAFAGYAAQLAIYYASSPGQLQEKLARLQEKLQAVLEQILQTVKCPEPPIPIKPKPCLKFTRCGPPPEKKSCFKCKPCCKPCDRRKPKPCPEKPRKPKCPEEKPKYPEEKPRKLKRPEKESRDCGCNESKSRFESHSKSSDSSSSHSSQSQSSHDSHSYRRGRYDSPW